MPANSSLLAYKTIKLLAFAETNLASEGAAGHGDGNCREATSHLPQNIVPGVRKPKQHGRATAPTCAPRQSVDAYQAKMAMERDRKQTQPAPGGATVHVMPLGQYRRGVGLGQGVRGGGGILQSVTLLFI